MPHPTLSLLPAALLGAILIGAATPASAQEGFGAKAELRGNPAQTCGNLAFVANSYSDTLSMIDMDEQRLVGTFPTGKSPVNPTFNRDWSKLYVANAAGGSLTVIDAGTRKVAEAIPLPNPKPSGLRFLPDGRHLAISFLGTNQGKDRGSLGVLDLVTGKLVKSIPVEVNPERFDITPDGKRAYVANLVSGSVSVVDLERGEIVATIPTPQGKSPFNIVVSPRGKRAYVGLSLGQSILEIDTETDQVISEIKTSAGPNGITFTPDGDNLLFTTVWAGKIQSYNLTAKIVSEGKSVGMLPGHLRLTQDGTRGLFVRPYGRQVELIDAQNMTVIKSIKTGTGPSTVAICGNP